MAFAGFTQGSIHGIKPARASKGSDWDTRPEAYDQGRLKGIPSTYHYPTNVSSERNKILSNRPYNPEPGMMASSTPGENWNWKPEKYETYRLTGKTNDPQFRLDPFIPQTVYKQVSHFQSHFATQDRLNPFHKELGALPQILAKVSQQKEEQEKGNIQVKEEEQAHEQVHIGDEDEKIEGDEIKDEKVVLSIDQIEQKLRERGITNMKDFMPRVFGVTRGSKAGMSILKKARSSLGIQNGMTLRHFLTYLTGNAYMNRYGDNYDKVIEYISIPDQFHNLD